MASQARFLTVFGLLITLLAAGCNSPYHADRGALFGGLLGAGTGAIIGDALGNTGAGAAIGAGVGALSGAAIGGSLDEIEAKNRAMIATQLGREVRAGAVTIDDVVMMSGAGVDDELIINHIRANGMTRVPGPQELVNLKNNGVSTAVIRVMQEPPPRPRTETVVIERPTPAPVIVEEYHYGPPVYHRPPYYHYRHRRPEPRVGWGVSFHN
ncbi:MAG TPA: glycine zipper domain-containing protein [Thermoguttaceae bacterium]|nr:glycine zipper domain-containing protein [Thermoguttaceae bacterium]